MLHKLLSCICLLLGGLAASYAQSANCNIPQLDAAMAGQGFQFLNVQGYPCSRYYYNPAITSNWSTAQGQAASVGAILVTISDQAENDAVWQAAVAAGVSGGVWIGYTDRVTEGTWLWEDGSTATFTNWNSGEPSNNTDICSSTGEDAAVMQMSNGRWNDVYLAPMFPCLFPPSYTSIIKVNLCPVLIVNDASICNGQSAALTASTTFGSPAYSYSWSSGQAAASISVTPSLTTNYAVTSTDRYGCAASDTATVTVAASAPPIINVSPDSVCENAGVQVSYSGNASPGAVFTWGFDGGTITSGSGAGPYQIQWATAGIKNITLTLNDNGCISPQGSASVVVSAGAIADAGPDVSVCAGGSVTLGSVPVTGYTYQWVPSIALSNPSVANPVFTPTSGTVACVVIATNSNGCVDTDTVLVTVTPTSGITLNSSGPVTFCSGGSVNLSVAGTYSSYSWSNGSTASFITVTQTGSYSLTAIDTGGCGYSSDTIVVSTSAGNLVIQLVSLRNVSCAGLLDGALEVSASGGTPAYSFAWNTFPVQNTSAISNLAGGVYTVIVTDQNFCADTEQYIITSPLPPVISVDSIIGTTCFGINDGSITVAASGGTPPFEYSLNGSSFQGSGSFSGLAAGDYAISARDSAGCSIDTAGISVAGSSIITATYSVNHPAPGASDGAVKINPFGGTPPYEFSLDGITYQTGSSFTNLEAGTYPAYVIDANGCIFTDSVTIGFLIGMDDLNEDLKLEVYPNPADEHITVSMSASRFGKISLTLISLTGKKHFEKDYAGIGTSLNVQIDIRSLPAGVYILVIETEQTKILRKVIAAK